MRNYDFFELITRHPLWMKYQQENILEGKTASEIASEFKSYCENHISYDAKYEMWFRILLEKAKEYSPCGNVPKIKLLDGSEIELNMYNVNSVLKLSEDDLNVFIKEWEEDKTHITYFTDERSKRYRSFRETRLYEEHLYDQDFIERFKHYAHPLVQSTIGAAFINTGDARGVGFIMNALSRAVIFPNIYWNNVRAIHGYIEAIWTALYLVDKIKNEVSIETIIPNCKVKLIELLFIYIERALQMEPQNIKNADLYNNRAELFYQKHGISQGIYTVVGITNPDLHFISDKYLAFYTANRLGIISPLYEQCLWDSKKMYEYGSLTYLNDENGYKYIEDATWMEIVNRAQKRSQIVAQCLFDEAEKGKVFLTKEQIENMLNTVLVNVSFEKVHFSGKFRT